MNSANDADIDAPEAWSSFTGDPNFVIADIDTGVNMAHPDLVGNIWTNPGEIAGNEEIAMPMDTSTTPAAGISSTMTITPATTMATVLTPRVPSARPAITASASLASSGEYKTMPLIYRRFRLGRDLRCSLRPSIRDAEKRKSCQITPGVAAGSARRSSMRLTLLNLLDTSLSQLLVMLQATTMQPLCTRPHTPPETSSLLHPQPTPTECPLSQTTGTTSVDLGAQLLFNPQHLWEWLLISERHLNGHSTRRRRGGGYGLWLPPDLDMESGSARKSSLLLVRSLHSQDAASPAA